MKTLRKNFINIFLTLTAVELAGCIEWRGNWAFGCDFWGNDMGYARIPGEQCGGRCASTPGCTHFTWTTFNGGSCWLKRGAVSKNNAFATNDRSMVCGVISEGPGPAPGPGVDGKTTRYWDCCKPSCSWRGNVFGNRNPVRSCQKDGWTTQGENAQSACNNGDAYPCNNQKPIVINDNLAYGFAAAALQGQSQQDFCCACYKLDFTSGPVAGKTMIVQITNTGGDVGGNQFDLQIPGGGVGIFNGCSRQWNSPSDGWGNRYGGVWSREMCNQLPREIRDGCFFRFDWFRGADNPTMKFSKVDCPSQLTAITGCSR